MHLGVCVWFSACEDRFLRGQKRELDSLGLVLKVFVSCPTWVLGTKLGSSGRAVNTLFGGITCWRSV